MKKDPEWFTPSDTENNKVYVSNLPLDITEEEFVEFMGKCGLIMKDKDNKYKIKLYDDGKGGKKGDGLCTYIKVDSVDLALQLLDGSYLRTNQVKVERASFQLKGQYDPSKKPRKNKKQKEKERKKQEALFAWKPEKLRGERPKNEKVVIVKNAFSPSEFENNVELILELKEDFRSEASKFGNCKKVEIFDQHKDGIAQIFMGTVEEADVIVEKFNGRYFGGKRLEAELWDGVSRYKIEESEQERAKRLEKWEKFIGEDKPEQGQDDN